MMVYIRKKCQGRQKIICLLCVYSVKCNLLPKANNNLRLPLLSHLVLNLEYLNGFFMLLN